jgi:hypothetical protein
MTRIRGQLVRLAADLRFGRPGRRWIGALAALALAGCSIGSDKPFLTPATADHPLGTPALVDALAPGDDGSWSHTGNGARLTLNPPGADAWAGWYVLSAPDRPAAGKPDEPYHFLLRRIDDGRYVLQLESIGYGLLVFHDDLWLLYADGDRTGCKSLTPAERRQFHVTAAPDMIQTRHCTIAGLADLEHLFRHILAKSPAPNMAFLVH